MNIVEHAEQTHREIEELFRQLQTEEDETQIETIRNELATTLAAHIASEHDVLVPMLLKHLTKKMEVYTFAEEHHLMTFALERCMSAKINANTFEAKIDVLKDVVCNHITDAEFEFLDRLKRVVDRKHLDEGGDLMMAAYTSRRTMSPTELARLLDAPPTKQTRAKPSARKKGPKATRRGKTK